MDALFGGACALSIAISTLFLPFSLVRAGFVLALRGPAFVRWRRPSKCSSILDWVYEDWWGFTGRGVQAGVRTFGLEVLTQGSFDEKVPGS
jgi:hypothetical protein